MSVDEREKQVTSEDDIETIFEGLLSHQQPSKLLNVEDHRHRILIRQTDSIENSLTRDADRRAMHCGYFKGSVSCKQQQYERSNSTFLGKIAVVNFIAGGLVSNLPFTLV